MYLRHEGYLYTNIHHSLQLGTQLSDLQQGEVNKFDLHQKQKHNDLNMEHFNCEPVVLTTMPLNFQLCLQLVQWIIQLTLCHQFTTFHRCVLLSQLMLKIRPQIQRNGTKLLCLQRLTMSKCTSLYVSCQLRETLQLGHNYARQDDKSCDLMTQDTGWTRQ